MKTETIKIVNFHGDIQFHPLSTLLFHQSMKNFWHSLSNAVVYVMPDLAGHAIMLFSWIFV